MKEQLSCVVKAGTISMSNISLIKDKDLIYKRWEMANFGSNAINVPQEKITQKLVNIEPIFNPPVDPVRSEDRAHFASMMTKFGEALQKSDEVIAYELISLAVDIAQAMMSVKLNIDTEAILPVVKTAISHLPSQTKHMKIRVSPADVMLLEEHLAEEISMHDWQLIGDKTIDRGGCLLETPVNLVDATNAVRWKKIAEALSLQKDWMGE